MISVGVTGGIGSGKSTICKLIELFNFPVYYADDRAKWIVNHNKNCKIKIIKHFGKQAYANGLINKKYMAEKVFSDPKNIKLMNSIVHPMVAEDYKIWLEKNKKSTITFKEAALLFETKSYKKLDKTLLVTALEKTRIHRVLKRDKHRNEEQIRSIIKNQLPENEKIKMADFIVDNSGEKLIIPQFLEILDKLKAEL